MQILESKEVVRNQVGSSNFSQYKSGVETDVQFYNEKYETVARMFM